MSVTIRPYGDDAWEADIRVLLPSGQLIRERRKAPAPSQSGARKWAEARERELLRNGKPKPEPEPKIEEVAPIPTLKEFAPRFVNGYAKANRQKPSGI